jgi:hypothetical protein
MCGERICPVRMETSYYYRPLTLFKLDFEFVMNEGKATGG